MSARSGRGFPSRDHLSGPPLKGRHLADASQYHLLLSAIAGCVVDSDHDLKHVRCIDYIKLFLFLLRNFEFPNHSAIVSWTYLVLGSLYMTNRTCDVLVTGFLKRNINKKTSFFVPSIDVHGVRTQCGIL